MDNICAEDLETIHEFLVESDENLSRLDQDLVELEKHPHDALLLGSIFRTIHTIKGACGFLAFSTLEGITHQAENILSQLRDGERELTPTMVSLILETVDATRKVLASIEKSGKEGPLRFEDLIERLRAESQTQAIVEQEPVLIKAATDLHVEFLTDEPTEIARAVVSEDRRFEGPDRRKQGRRETDRDEDELTQHSAAADSNIRVGVGLLDKLMDLVGELVLTRNQILQFNTEREDPALNATSQRLNLITTELQEGVMKTRMQPIGVVWNKLPRVVRDMSISMGKEIRLEMDGAETELDRTIIEAIKDPLMHLVRNSCDHGVETPEVRRRAGKSPQGLLTLRAYHEGGQVNIEVGDDGAGIDVARIKQKAIEKGLLRPELADKLSDREALSLIFEPGFSTAQVVTNISGRGVGMDVVKSHIEKIGGVVDIFSRLGEGSTVKIRIPLTLAIIPGLVITSGGERFVIPQVSLLELIRIDGDSLGKHIEYVHGTPVYRRRGSLLPIAYLNQVLGLQSADRAEAVSLVVLQAEDRQFGLVVDGINDTQEIVVKPLGKQLKGLTLYAGATIMGDGRVALILDVLGIGQCSGVFGGVREPARAADKHKAQLEVEQQRLLLFRAGSFDRLAVPLSLVARLEEFPQSAIEYAGGGQVVQYRDRILPLVSLRSVLEPGSPGDDLSADPVQVVVFNEGDVSVGMVVDQILDVAEEAVTVRQRSDRKGLLGSAVVGQKVTDFLDLNEVIRAVEGKWSQSADERTSCKKILVLDASAFSRGIIRGNLDMAGYSVLEAGNLTDAIRRLEQQPVDVVIAALDLQADGSSALLTSLRGRSEWAKIPVLALVDAAGMVRASSARAAGFQDCQAKFESVLVLESVARLVSSLAPIEEIPVGTGETR
ncbi:MAG: chemotaxis protein CheW [Acidobacteriaceae bacterium]|jgi:two-component system chemotaxis sensor kinase CheA